MSEAISDDTNSMDLSVHVVRNVADRLADLS